MKFLFLLCISITLTGCSAVSSQNVKWEYKREVIDPANGKTLIQLVMEGVDVDKLLLQYHKKLNDHGEQGWELITISEAKEHIFKRKL